MVIIIACLLAEAFSDFPLAMNKIKILFVCKTTTHSAFTNISPLKHRLITEFLEGLAALRALKDLCICIFFVYFSEMSFCYLCATFWLKCHFLRSDITTTD